MINKLNLNAPQVSPKHQQIINYKTFTPNHQKIYKEDSKSLEQAYIKRQPNSLNRLLQQSSSPQFLTIKNVNFQKFNCSNQKQQGTCIIRPMTQQSEKIAKLQQKKQFIKKIQLDTTNTQTSESNIRVSTASDLRNTSNYQHNELLENYSNNNQHFVQQLLNSPKTTTFHNKKQFVFDTSIQKPHTADSQIKSRSQLFANRSQQYYKNEEKKSSNQLNSDNKQDNITQQSTSFVSGQYSVIDRFFSQRSLTKEDCMNSITSNRLLTSSNNNCCSCEKLMTSISDQNVQSQQNNQQDLQQQSKQQSNNLEKNILKSQLIEHNFNSKFLKQIALKNSSYQYLSYKTNPGIKKLFGWINKGNKQKQIEQQQVLQEQASSYSYPTSYNNLKNKIEKSLLNISSDRQINSQNQQSKNLNTSQVKSNSQGFQQHRHNTRRQTQNICLQNSNISLRSHSLNNTQDIKIKEKQQQTDNQQHTQSIYIEDKDSQNGQFLQKLKNLKQLLQQQEMEQYDTEENTQLSQTNIQHFYKLSQELAAALQQGEGNIKKLSQNQLDLLDIFNKYLNEKQSQLENKRNEQIEKENKIKMIAQQKQKLEELRRQHDLQLKTILLQEQADKQKKKQVAQTVSSINKMSNIKIQKTKPIIGEPNKKVAVSFSQNISSASPRDNIIFLNIQDNVDEPSINLDRKDLTIIEQEYIINKRKEFLENLEPFRNMLKQKYSQQVLQGQSVEPEEKMTEKELKLLDNDSIFVDQVDCIAQYPVNYPPKKFFYNKSNIRKEIVEINDFLEKKFQRYKEEDEHGFKNFIKKKDRILAEFLTVNEDCLTQLEIDIIIKEYQKDKDNRNYEFIEQAVQKLKFFKKYSKLTRLQLLSVAQLIHIEQGQIVFNQGDVGDMMYIIIKGSCHVRIKRKNMGGQIENPVIVTIYDGSSFGELALMQTKKLKGMAELINRKEKEGHMLTFKELKSEFNKELNKDNKLLQYNEEKKEQTINQNVNAQQQNQPRRAATIETSENTFFLTISREYFTQVFLNVMKKENDDKLSILQTLPFFDNYDEVSLIPLANLLETRVYKLGDLIVRELQEPRAFFLISSGRVKIIKEQFQFRTLEALGLEPNRTKKRLNFSKKDYQHLETRKLAKLKINEKSDFKAKILDDDIVSELDYEINRKKVQQYQKLNQDNQGVTFTQQIMYGTMDRGQFFFQRAIVDEYLKLDPSIQDEVIYNPKQRAKLSIVADSAETIIYVMERHNMHLLPQQLRKQFITGIMIYEEFDNFYDEKQIQMNEEWDPYKVQLMEEVVKLRNEKKLMANKYC